MAAYLKPIVGRGMDDRLKGVSKNDTKNTLRLASGHLSIAVVLLEPIADGGAMTR